MRAFLLAAGVLGGVTPTLAEPPTTAPPTYDESIVVTASLEEQEEKDSSASVTVIGREEIEARQATTVQELLRTVPGVTVVRSGSPGKATSVFSRGTESDHTLVLWNGVELNDPFFGGFDWAFLPTDGVERVEVVRGPSSALYGSEAIGGVVQVLTRGAEDTRVRMEGGGDHHLRGSVSGGWRTGPVTLDVAGHVRRGDGRLDNDFYDGEELSLRADWAASESTAVGLVTRVGDAEIGVPFDFLGNPAPERRQERSTRQVAVPFTWESGPWQVQARLARSETELVLRDPDDPFTGGETDADRNDARIVGSYRFRDGLWAAVGTDWEREEATSVQVASEDLEGASQETWSTFGQVFWDAGRVTLDLGLRRDDNDAFGAETTVRGAATVRLGGGARLRASYGEGFRAPSLGDLYFPGFGNPDLEPETSETVEVGLDWSTTGTGGSWNLSLAGYSTDLEDLIVFDFARSLPFNIGRARSRGIELEAGWVGDDLPGRPGIRLTGAYLDAEDRTSGEPLPRRPETSGSLLLTWSPARTVSLSTVVTYVGERTDVGDARLEDYSTVQLAGSWRWTERLEPYLRVENLFDEQYEEAAGFPALGRRVIGGLQLRF